MTNQHFAINGRNIASDQTPFIIAEVGINHGGDVNRAVEMLHAAAKAGADAVKFQTFVAEEFISRESPYFDIFKDTELAQRDVALLVNEGKKANVVVFSAVFDIPSADLWESFDPPAYKIASGDITHIPLMRHVASFGKPMILSSGGATMDEIGTALDSIRSASANTPVALMHCVSNYPTEAKDANLACIATIRNEFHVPVGFSDHTLDNTVAIAASALGADLIEKHFTLDRDMPGPDHALSCDPAGFRDLVEGVQASRLAIGSAEKWPVEDATFIPQMRRSVTANVMIPSGTEITREMLAIKRPGTGIPPVDIDLVVGRRATRDLGADETLNREDLSD